MKLEQVESKYGEPGGWKISGWETVDELLTFRDQQRQAFPENQSLFILDDVGQADYTSGHAVGKHGLDDIPNGLLTAVEQAIFGKECYLTLERRTRIIIKNLNAHIKKSKLSLDSGVLIPIDAEPDLINAINAPVAVFNSTALCLQITSSNPSMAIAAKPNGYFAGDLTPAENYLLAEHLRKQFGYEILGLGSYLAAYIRPEPFNKDEVLNVIESIRGIYDVMNDELINQWAEASADKRWFLLSYRGS